MKKHIRENTGAPAVATPAAPVAGQPAQQGEQKSSPAVQKLEKKFASIKNLDDILAGIKQKGDAAAVLALLAAKLGGDKLKGSDILKKATAETVGAETKDKTAQNAAAPTTGKPNEAIQESFKSVNHFLSYLFE